LAVFVTRVITPHQTGKADQAEKAQPAPIEVAIVCAGAVHGGTTAFRPRLISARHRSAGRVSASAGLSKGCASAPEQQSGRQSVGGKFAWICHGLISSIGYRFKAFEPFQSLFCSSMWLCLTFEREIL
jgi:hypothetical protein